MEQKVEDMLDMGISDFLKCPICLRVFEDPIQTDCGHNFCSTCFFQAIELKSSCPICRKLFPANVSSFIRPNFLARGLIEEYKTGTINKIQEGAQERVIFLSMTKSYAPNWKSRQGVRECIQNWYDGAQEKCLKVYNPNVPKDLISFDENGGSRQLFQVLKTISNKKYKYVAIYNGNKVASMNYSSETMSIQLKNYDVNLGRKILLLGYSTKVGKEHFVGQFGEGLKVGILALIRENKSVQTATGPELWKFGLKEDLNFGEKVLSVTIAKSKSKNLNSTITTIGGITEEDWKIFETDFLFLSQPSDFVSTIAGDLLLEEKYMHKLYVKGFWISDMKEDGLYYGINLLSMELDRDRRAVVKKFDVDRKVSDIWTKAIVKKKSLIPIYFDLLMENHQMIRLGSMYISNEGVELIVEHFVKLQGPNAFPVCMRSGVDEEEQKNINLVEQQFNLKPINVPEPLFQILSKKIESIQTLINKLENTSHQVPLHTLSPPKIKLLERAIELATKGIDSNFTLNKVEIWNFSDEKNLGVLNNMGIYQLSRKLLDIDFIHSEYKRCTSTNLPALPEGECTCCELKILTTLINCRASKQTSQVREISAFEKLMTERLLCNLIYQLKLTK